MNPELQQKLIQILSGLQSAASNAGNFAAGQAPDVLRSYVMLGRAQSSVAMIFGLSLLVLAYWLLRKGLKGFELEDDGFIAFCASGTAAFLAVLEISISYEQFLAVWLAPKVWLIQQLAHLAK